MAGGNLIPIRSESEAREKGKQGGIKSGEARRRKKAMRERLEALLGMDRQGMEGADALAVALFEKALSGDVKAIELCLQMVGETPGRVKFPLKKLERPEDAPRVTAAILQAVASGKLTPEDAQKIASIALAHARLLETADLDRRLSALENGT